MSVQQRARKRKPCWCVQCEGAFKSHDVARRHQHRPRYKPLGHNPELENAEEAADDTLPAPLQQYCVEVVGEVASGRLCATGADNMIKITNRCYSSELSGEVEFPSSWHTTQKIATAGREPESFTRDFCAGCGWLFPDDVLTSTCEGCGEDRFDLRGKPNRQAFYFDVKWRVQSLFSTLSMAKRLLPTENFLPTEGEVASHSIVLRDCYQGRIMQRLFRSFDAALLPDIIYLTQCNDGVEVEKNVSYTPCTAEVLNLEPQVRSLLGSIWLLALFPPHVRDYQSMFLPLVNMYKELAPGGRGVKVWDAYQQRTRTIYVVLAWIVNDIRGVPNSSCGSYAPCYVGSCVWCKVRGVKVHRKTAIILPGTVTQFPSSDERRARYAREFSKVSKLVALSKSPRPVKRTRASCIRSGERAARDKEYAKEAFKDVDVFTKALDYHDKPNHTIYDLAHEVRIIRDTVCFQVVTLHYYSYIDCHTDLEQCQGRHKRDC